MDVDGVVVNTMMAEEKANCMKRGTCFFCKEGSHMAKNCQKKYNAKGQKLWQTNQVTIMQTQVNQVATDQTTTPVTTPVTASPLPTQIDHDMICGNMRSLPQDERRALLEQMLDNEGF
jgi:hypothetical protein